MSKTESAREEPSDRAARAEANLFAFCRVVTEFEELKLFGLCRAGAVSTKGQLLLSESRKWPKHLVITKILLLSLSLRYSPTIAYTLLSCAGTRVNIRLSLHPCKGSRSVFVSRDEDSCKQISINNLQIIKNKRQL